MMWLAILVVLIFGLTLFGFYAKSNRGVCKSKADLKGKTALVTGSTTGIGYETALDLARRNARVIITCRNLDEGQDVCTKIKATTGNHNVVCKLLDLASLESVRQFAHNLNTTEEKLHIVVNNAAIVWEQPVGRRTEDGLHHLMQTNYFGPFLLNNLLLDLLKKSAPSRIVVLTSIAYKIGDLKLDNLNFDKYIPATGTYNASKLALILFTKELSKRLAGTGVTANCLHPGSVNTTLFSQFPLPLRILIYTIAYFFFRSPKEGAQTSIYAAVSEEMEGVSGKFLSECRIDMLTGAALDDDMAQKLWLETEKIVGLS